MGPHQEFFHSIYQSCSKQITVVQEVVEAPPGLLAGANAVDAAGLADKALPLPVLEILLVAPRPRRPGVPPSEVLAAGHLAGLPDHCRTVAGSGTEALAAPAADPEAARHRALAPVGPAGPLAGALDL